MDVEGACGEPGAGRDGGGGAGARARVTRRGSRGGADDSESAGSLHQCRQRRGHSATGAGEGTQVVEEHTGNRLLELVTGYLTPRDASLKRDEHRGGQ